MTIDPRFNRAELEQRCGRDNCAHLRELHHYSVNRCTCLGCECKNFMERTVVDDATDPEPRFALRAGKLAHYQTMHALIGLLMGADAPETEIAEAVAAMNQMISWRLRNCTDIRGDVP